MGRSLRSSRPSAHDLRNLHALPPPRAALWRDVRVVGPAAMEVVNEPHDLVENLGRPMEDVFEELTEVLPARNAPVGAFML